MTLIRNARIQTMDPQRAEAPAMRTREGLITEVSEGLTPEPGEEVLDLGGATVLPGLWDTHIHLLFYAMALRQLDLTGCRDRDDLLGRVRRRAAATAPDGWVEGQGWEESRWPDQRLPNLAELDEAGLGRPVYLARSDLHSVLVNSEALRRAGIDATTPDPPGGRFDRDPHGQLTGRVVDLAIHRVRQAIPQPSGIELEEAVLEAVARLHRWGIVGVCDQRIKDHLDGPQAWDIYRRRQPRLRIHCNVTTAGPRMPDFGEGDDWIRAGHAKFFSDGSMGSRTARLKQPYLGGDERGIWLTPPELLREAFAEAHRRGYPVSCHAIGDEAVAEVLRAFADVPAHPLDRIEHLQILAPEDLPALRRWGGTASMQPVHLLDDRYLADACLGPRAAGYYRLRALKDAGLRLAFGSDAPVATPDPWLGLLAATQRRARTDESPWFAQECLTVEEALAAYTREAAVSLGWSRTGQLKPGFWADWIAVEPSDEAWSQVSVCRTVVGGQTVFNV